MPDRDPLGIGFEPASHSVLSPIGLCPLPLLRQGVLRFAFHRRELFSARPSHPKLEGPRVDSGMREAERCTDVTNAVVGEADGAAVLAELTPPLNGGRRKWSGQSGNRR